MSVCNTSYLKSIVLLICIAVLAACTSAVVKNTNDSYSASLTESVDLKNKSGKTGAGNSGSISTIYLGSKSMPLKTTAILPDIFHQIKRYQYPGQKMRLERAVSIIAAETGMLIRISVDVTGGMSPGSAVSKSAVNGVRPPLPSSLGSSLNSAGDSIVLNTEKSLSEILDTICTQLGLNWEYRNGVVVIQRMVTRTFQLKVHAGTRQFDTSKRQTLSNNMNKLSINGIDLINIIPIHITCSFKVL